MLQRRSSLRTFSVSRRCLRALLCACPLLISACLNGGGRYQDKMGEGTPLYQEQVLHWQASDGAAVPFCRWLPPQGTRKKGIVVAVPGLEEAAVEWAPLGRHLARQGYEVYASDLRGQGRDFNHPQRGNYHRWQRWVQDVNEFAALQVRGRRLPVAYMGQSLGCMIVLSAAASAPAGHAPAALVLQSPGIVLAYPPVYARPLLAAAQILTLNQMRITGPAALELGGAFLMSNMADEKRWERSPDRLCEGFTCRYLSACFNVGQHARHVPKTVRAPVLIQYGKSDGLFKLSQRSVEQFHAAFSSPSKELWRHPDDNASHDLVNDRLMQARTLQKTAAWLDAHLRGQDPQT